LKALRLQQHRCSQGNCCKARQKLLMELVSRITGHAVPTTAEAEEDGDDIPASMAHDSGLEFVEAD